MKMPPISVLPILVVFVWILLRQLGLDDYFYQLKSGEYFFKTGRVLAENQYSFTAPHFEWINHAWGSGVLFYGVFSVFGHYGALCVGAICFLAMAYIYNQSLRARIKTPSTLFLLNLGFAALLGIPMSALRPWTFSNVLFVLLVSWLARPKKAVLNWLPFLILFWANIHGSFPIGILVCYLLLYSLYKKAEISRSHLLAIGGLVSIAPFFNPYGEQAVLLPFKFFFIHAFNHQNTGPLAALAEWQPLLSFSGENDMFYAFVAVLLCIPILNSIRKKPSPILLSKAVLCLATLLMTLLASRNFFYFYTSCTLLFSSEIHAGLSRLRIPILKKEGPVHWAHWSVLPAALILLIGFLRGPILDPIYWPPKLIGFLNTPNIMGGRVFWDFDFSNIPIFYDRGAVFFDGREYCYPPEVIQDDYALNSSQPSKILTVLRKWDITALVLKHGSPLDINLPASSDSVAFHTLFEDQYSRVVSVAFLTR
jgi:hypothetical protein